MASEEFFYLDKHGDKQDAALHNYILDNGDDEAALEVSRAVMRKLGMDPEALLGKSVKAKSNPYHEPAGSPEGGQFTSGGGGGDAKPSASAGPKVQSGLGVSSLNTTRVRAGIRVIPKAHAERIKDVPIYVVKDSKEIPGNKNPTNEGLFTAAKDGKDAAIFIPTTMQAHGLKGKREYPLTAISRSTVHEMGHALDHHSGWKHTDLINKEVVHGMVQMTAKERKDAGYFLTSPHEAFAELYSLAYDAHVDQDVPRYFGSLTRERAETVFADALAKVKAIP